MCRHVEISGVKLSTVWYLRDMTPKLSEEQRQAIVDCQGRPVEVEDDRTQRVYVLVARDEFHRLMEDKLCRELQIAFDQADAGDVGDWDIAEMLREAPRH